MKHRVSAVLLSMLVSATVAGCSDTMPQIMDATIAAGAPSVAGTSASAAGTNAAKGCGTESFAAIYQSIFADTTYNCTGAPCHGRDAGLAMVGNLSLSSVQTAYTQLVGKNSDSTMCAGKPRVVAGDPAKSLLVQKLRGDKTDCGGPMPVGADEITDDQLKRITDWISAGACNN